VSVCLFPSLLGWLGRFFARLGGARARAHIAASLHGLQLALCGPLAAGRRTYTRRRPMTSSSLRAAASAPRSPTTDPSVTGRSPSASPRIPVPQCPLHLYPLPRAPVPFTPNPRTTSNPVPVLPLPPMAPTPNHCILYPYSHPPTSYRVGAPAGPTPAALSRAGRRCACSRLTADGRWEGVSGTILGSVGHQGGRMYYTTECKASGGGVGCDGTWALGDVEA
jgi:hypothetical protein